MDKLLNVADIADRYKCSKSTARNRMRQMNHMENPLMVSEVAVFEWEQKRTYKPQDPMKRKDKKCKKGEWNPGISKLTFKA